MTSEQTIQKSMIDFLFSIGAEPYNIVAASKSGVSDILCCLPNGRFLAVEVKKVGGITSALQRYRIKKVIRCGGLGIITNNLDELKEYLIKSKIKLDNKLNNN